MILSSAANTNIGSAGSVISVLNGARLVLGAANQIPDATRLSVNSGGTFDVNGWSETVESLTGGGAITNGGRLTVSPTTTDANFSGVISGGGFLTMNGSGTQTLSGANTYADKTYVWAGTLQVNNTLASASYSLSGGILAIGASNVLPNTSAVVLFGGTLAMGNFNNTVGSVSLQSGSITGTGGTLASTTTFGVESGTVSANLGGSVGLTKTTGSTVTLSGANTYTGATIVSAGTLQVNSTLASTTYTLDGGSLVIGASNFLPNNSAVLLTGGTLVMGNFNNTVGSVTLLTGSITGTGGTLTSTTDFDMQSGTVSAILGGGGGLRKSTSSTVTLSAANTYTGVTSVVAGTLQVNNTLASASYSLDFGGLVIGASNLLPNNSAVNLTGGTLALGNFNNTVGSVRLGSGSITGTGGTLTSTTDFELWNGSVSAILSGGVGLSKSVGTTVTLSAANSYSGNTTVSQGILALSGSGSFASSPTIAVGYGTKLDVKGVTGGANHDGTHFALVSGQTLHGNGIVIGAMDVGAGATIAPGDSIGTLGVSDLSLTSATAVVKLEIDFGVTPDADLLDVTGGITLANSTLDLSLLNLSPTSVPETFLVVANDLSDAVTETFGTITGVPNGYIATVDYAFTGADALGRIGDGNDIAVTVNQIVPEPSTWTMLGLGLPALLGLRRFRR